MEEGGGPSLSQMHFLLSGNFLGIWVSLKHAFPQKREVGAEAWRSRVWLPSQDSGLCARVDPYGKRSHQPDSQPVSGWAVTPETKPDSGRAPSQAQRPCGSGQKKKPHQGWRIRAEGVPRLFWAAWVRTGPGWKDWA